MHFDFTGVILRHQRKKAEKVYRDLESLRKMAGKSNNLPGDGDSLQLSIYRKFEETECLLDQLKIQEDSPSIMSSEQSSVQTPVKNVERSFSAEPTNGNIRLPADTRDIVVGVASKKPKDEVSEYLRTARTYFKSICIQYPKSRESCLNLTLVKFLIFYQSQSSFYNNLTIFPAYLEYWQK